MKHFFRLFPAAAFTILTAFTACSHSTPYTLGPAEFSAQLQQHPQSPLLDVRTPEEFAQGHLANARNVDWNGSLFEQQVSTFDKTAPVYVYCLSGGRSAEAAQQMRNEGFSHVYELKGGIMKWRAAGLPETKENAAPASPGMSLQQFNTLLDAGTPVLVDFYADWCAPCKKMKPGLDSIAAGMKDKVTVIRINAPDNLELCKALQVDALPVLQLYRQHALVWSHQGFMSRDEIVKRLDE